MIEGLVEGRVVHYVVAESDCGANELQMSMAGRHVPAIVVRDWGAGAGTVNLLLFLDGANAHQEGRHTKWVTSVPFDDTYPPAGRTWHWPHAEPAAPVEADDEDAVGAEQPGA